MDDEAKTVEEIMRYKGKGGHAIVEAQPVGCGRMAAALEQEVERLKEIAWNYMVAGSDK